MVMNGIWGLEEGISEEWTFKLVSNSCGREVGEGGFLRVRSWKESLPKARRWR